MTVMPLLLVIPLAWALLSLLLPRLPQGLLAIVGMLLQLSAASWLWYQVQTHGAFRYAIGDWDAPLGISLIADGLTVTLLLMTALIAVVCAFYALFYLRSPKHAQAQQYFWPLFWFLLAALNGIWLAGDLFNLYVGLELVTFCAVGMVALTGTRAALGAGLRYLYAALLGSLAYLLGVALLYSVIGSLDMAQISAEQSLLRDASFRTQAALALMTFGLLMKTAIFPLHNWLPPAHGGALAPVSAILSALVVKSSFYILARLWMDIGFDLMPISAAQLLGTLGALAMLWGGWQAFRQDEIKMLVAYSTVAQLGYLMLLFPLTIGQSAAAATLAWQGTMLHLLAHGFAKAAMFLAVGSLVQAVGRNRVADMAGISSKMPLALFAFGLSAVSLMGLPPSGGFNAKWLLLQSALQSQQWHWVAVLLSASLLTAAYVFRVFNVSFKAAPAHSQAQQGLQQTPTGSHVALDLCALLLAGIAIALGLAAALPVQLLTLPQLL